MIDFEQKIRDLDLNLKQVDASSEGLLGNVQTTTTALVESAVVTAATPSIQYSSDIVGCVEATVNQVVTVGENLGETGNGSLPNEIIIYDSANHGNEIRTELVGNDYINWRKSGVEKKQGHFDKKKKQWEEEDKKHERTRLKRQREERKKRKKENNSNQVQSD